MKKRRCRDGSRLQRATQLDIKDFTEDNLSKEQGPAILWTNGAKMAQKRNQRIEKPFNHRCYCSAENCLVKLDFSENGYYVQRSQWDVSEKRRGRRREDVKRRRLECVLLCLCVRTCFCV